MDNQKTSFFSGYSYLRPMEKGFVSSVDNGFGAQEVNTSVVIPNSIKQRPPYVQYYFEYPAGTYRPMGKPGDVAVGNDSNNLYFAGFDADIPFNAQFWIHYIIYERAVI
jgi:hypothetical protein